MGAPNPLAAADKSQPKTINKVTLCLDPAIALEPEALIGAEPICGEKKPSSETSFHFRKGVAVSSIEPVFRSTLGIFRFVGSLLNRSASPTARLFQDQGLVFDARDDGSGCFTSVGVYCVPNDSLASKETIAILDALVVLKTKASALPITPSVQLIPGG